MYLRARDYDPATGQFLTVDPALSITHQPYAYASNNPLLATDPYGLWTIDNGLDWLAGSLLHGPGANVTSFIVGFGDGASFGLTDMARSASDSIFGTGLNCTFNKDGSYVGGAVAGGVVTAVVSGGASAAGGGAGSAAVQVSNETLVIGRGMARVVPYAEQIGARTYAGTPSWVPLRNETIDLFFNKAFISSEMRAGTRIVDIGAPAGATPSQFYELEQRLLNGYTNYVKDLQP
ncbi:hypothetical protein E3O46_13490 [Cryobacterium glucosi]|uniref:RHS repeat-associated core domain-containing protein n=1 Tax=Cryobacterium glucosi TaxID=1259175 RepID=A0ABY2IK45_9MICO|nr:hypothetical protein E3O59_09890 [Cryobacterium sp. MDB2-33-2]TFC18692.1 hypothetical protein E3O46_13490 [Cryobacterium glucosi]